MSRRWLYIGLSILAVTLCYFGFDLFFERYEFEYKTGYSKEARRNPYLAAKLFVEKTGGKATTNVSKLKFNELGRFDSVIITNVDAMLITETQISNALRWIENGGTLIVGVKKELESGRSILDTFDLSPYKVESLSNDLDQALSDVGSEETTSERLKRINENIKKQQQEKKSEEQGQDKSVVEKITETINTNTYMVNTEQDQLEIKVNRRLALDHYQIDYSKLNGITQTDKKYTAIKWDGDKNGPRLVEFNYGAGKFIASVDLRIWSNYRIKDVDNAYLLAHLTSNKGVVRIYYDFISVSLWNILKQNFLHTLLAFAAFLGAWLWFYGLRVQPLKHFVSTERRDFNEHLQAGASFLAERQQATKLLKPLEEDIQQQMNRFHPGFKQLSKSDQAKALIDQTRLSSKLINRWLQYCNHQLSENQLQQALKIGQTIRKKL